MVIGYHLIWTVYVWWLPNDPRGSSSHEIRVEKLKPLGDIHYGRKKVQPGRTELRSFHAEARELLNHEVLEFEPTRFPVLAKAFAETARINGYQCVACAILPNHVHMLVLRHWNYAEVMIEKFQVDSRDRLVEAGLRHPLHPVWGGPGWKVFLNTPADIVRIIKYIEGNPEKDGLPRQTWDFVVPYVG